MNQQYGVNDDVTKSIDKLQQENHCCGDTGGSSWNGTSWQQRDEQVNSVPDSCCKTQTEGCGKRLHPSNINNEVEEFFEKHLSLLAIVGIGVACIQLIGIVVTLCILRFVEEY
ncbi:hypothetical protein OS493_011374 [Desmophyllum pertusum]|uniref:Tetraspanin n=1 Tax=Desmophyllum pertusum TaxID=174260 RepID=A0A9W9Z2I7_9CNID|nr:hypothetical protein OS493_011374 [Desmophyllum pertusum]